MVKPDGPPDFGGTLAAMLWGVRLQFSPCMEFLLLFGGVSAKERSLLPGAKRIVAPELYELLRCSRGVRLGTMAAVEYRRCTISHGVPRPLGCGEVTITDMNEVVQDELEALVEMCGKFEEKYAESWTTALSLLGPRHEFQALSAGPHARAPRSLSWSPSP